MLLSHCGKYMLIFPVFAEFILVMEIFDAEYTLIRPDQRFFKHSLRHYNVRGHCFNWRGIYYLPSAEVLFAIGSQFLENKH